jgi:hypothetical protein
MMFIIRTGDEPPNTPSVQVKAVRKTPAIVPNGTGKSDYFYVGEAEAMATLRDQGWELVELRDGWYGDDSGGGIVISGHGKYWEVRDTPFTVREAAGPVAEMHEAETADGDQVNVRRAIFGV